MTTGISKEQLEAMATADGQGEAAWERFKGQRQHEEQMRASH